MAERNFDVPKAKVIGDYFPRELLMGTLVASSPRLSHKKISGVTSGQSSLTKIIWTIVFFFFLIVFMKKMNVLSKLVIF